MIFLYINPAESPHLSPHLSNHIQSKCHVANGDVSAEQQTGVHFPPQTLIPKWEAALFLEMRAFVEVLWLALGLSEYKLFYVSLQP